MESIWNLIPTRRGIGSRLTRGALVREINEGRDLGNSKHRRQKVLETEREEVNARRTRRGEFRIVERFVLHKFRDRSSNLLPPTRVILASILWKNALIPRFFWKRMREFGGSIRENVRKIGERRGRNHSL